MPVSYTNFQQQKHLPTVGGGTPPSHTLLPRSLRSLGLNSRFGTPSHITAPLRLNPGYATVT